MNNDLAELTELNHDYVASVQNSDVKRFDEILAADFYCSNPDKSLVDRAAFLKQTAVPVIIKNLTAHDVKIRVLGDFAIIHAATSYTTADGQQAHGRYTDCWAKQNGTASGWRSRRMCRGNKDRHSGARVSANSRCAIAHRGIQKSWREIPGSALRAAPE